MDEKKIRVSSLAREVLKLARNTLLVRLRFLDAALNRLEPIETDAVRIATDGRYLAYDPWHVLNGFRSNNTIPVREYLHVVLHCIYRHMFVNTDVELTAWDLACDIAAEYTIDILGLSCTSNGREADRQSVFGKLKEKAGQLTAEKLYRYFLGSETLPEEVDALQKMFRADDHGIWYMTDSERAALLPVDESGNGEGLRGDGSDRDGGDGEDADSGSDDAADWRSLSEEDWKSISERIQMDIETFSKNHGSDPQALLQNLREVNRERYDYTSFLRHFSVMGEVMRVSDDEFDYIFYTYGLQLYGNMPLVEQLEYRESRRIREFVIAIDTSGSVSGETVQKFIQKTWNILKSTESFFSKINLHIIQCDAAVQEDARVTSQEEFDEYMKTMEIHGLGGTDFRPVFDYVDSLVEKKEFTNLKGLIYFTDGFGTFPVNMPGYETAFVFLDEENNNYDVPPWAMKLILRKDEI